MYGTIRIKNYAGHHGLTRPLTLSPSQIDSLPLVLVVRVFGVCPVLWDLGEVEVPQEVLHRLVHRVEGCAEACSSAVTARVLSVSRAGDCGSGSISSRPEGISMENIM